jgi:hypothetical protein
MAEMRRPVRGSSSRDGRGPGEPSRAGGGGRRAPVRKPTPMWVKVGLILSPIALIGLLLAIPRESKEPEVPVAKVIDPNAKIKTMTSEVPKIEADYRELQKLIRAEDPSVVSKQQGLQSRIDKWMTDWDEMFEPKRDAEGKLPPDLQGYQTARSRINQIRGDLLKSSGF